MTDRAERALAQFPDRQLKNGYFRSQEGEWDANGEVLWILKRYHEMTGTPLPDSWHEPVAKGARWILKKRLSDHLEQPHAGLLPAGFSAEHLGPNDYYYWDDFWGIAGLRAAADLFESLDKKVSDEFTVGARAFSRAVALPPVHNSHHQSAGQAHQYRAEYPFEPHRTLLEGI